MTGTTRSTSVSNRLLLVALAVVTAVAALVAAPLPAHATETVTLEVNDGRVGVMQTVRATVQTDLIGFPSGKVTFSADGNVFGVRSVGGSLGNQAQVSWIPRIPGQINVTATFTPSSGGNQASDSRTVTISGGQSVTAISTPGSAAAASTIQLTATVRSQSGQYIPTGTVTFMTRDGAVIGQAGVDGQGVARVNYQVPNNLTTVYVYAQYGGDGAVGPSRSRTDSIQVNRSGATVVVVAPQTNWVNTPVSVTAQITPAVNSGNVRFTADNRDIGTAGVSNGVATVTWTPVRTGPVTLIAYFSGTTGVNAGSGRNSVVVVEPLKPDQITVTPVGGTGAWVAGETITLANGSSLQLTAQAASRKPVSLTVDGPCSIDGTTLHVNGVGGTCVLTASTGGGDGYSPASVSFNIVTAAGVQVATISAPESGRYKVGETLTLGRANTKTNIGQQITWKVTVGKKLCKVVRKGAKYKLELRKKGTCRVLASAPAVAGQWTAFAETRTYKIK